MILLRIVVAASMTWPLINCSKLNQEEVEQIKFQHHLLNTSEPYDAIAPDNSEIRLLSRAGKGNMCHLLLPENTKSVAVSHKTIDELWFCLAGKGKMWRKQASQNQEEIIDVTHGVSMSIPQGTHFQFKNTGDSPLEFVIVSMPPWPGDQESL